MNLKSACSLLILSLALHAAPPGASAGTWITNGARLAIIGDSITEAKQYSRFIETYLTVCEPGLQVEVFQFGWSGERAPDFVRRMDRDLALFRPTLATLCYGMNDGGYRSNNLYIDAEYRKAMGAIAQKFKETGVAVVVGGPGAVDTDRFKNPQVSAEAYNHNLAGLSQIAGEIAASHGFPFARLHQVMTQVMAQAKAERGPAYDVGGLDGIHPRANGHLIMAYAFLKELGLGGDLGTITLDFQGTSQAVGGHDVRSFSNGVAEVVSQRYPFCITDDPAGEGTAASILPYLPFQQDLNRLMLVVKNATGAACRVTWGQASRVFSRAQLESGVNLAAEFNPNPFSKAFIAVDQAVAAKQQVETMWAKDFKRFLQTLNNLRPQGTAEVIAAAEPLEQIMATAWKEAGQRVKESFQPVTHSLTIEDVGE